MDFISLSRFENLEHVDLFIRVVLNVRNGGWLMAGWLAGWLVFGRVGDLFGFGMLNWEYWEYWEYWLGCEGFLGWAGDSAAG